MLKPQYNNISKRTCIDIMLNHYIFCVTDVGEAMWEDPKMFLKQKGTHYTSSTHQNMSPSLGHLNIAK